VSARLRCTLNFVFVGWRAHKPTLVNVMGLREIFFLLLMVLWGQKDTVVRETLWSFVAI